MKNRKIVLLLLIIAGIMFITYGFTQYKQEKPNDNNNSTDNIEPIVDKKDHQYSGIYSNSEESIYIFQNDSDLYFTTSSFKGKTIITNGNATYERVEDEQNRVYSFSISKDILTLTSNDDVIKSGEYTKINTLSLEKYFDYKFGDYNLFNSKYNGYYHKDDLSIYIYQIAEKMVNVIINCNDFEMNANFKIRNDGLLEINSTIEELYIEFSNSNTITFNITDKTSDVYKEKLNGSYQKEKNITMYDVLDNELVYYYQ